MKVISKSVLISAASELKTYNDNILQDVNDISGLMVDLLSFWDGDDAKTFVSKMNDEIIPEFNKSYDKLDDYILFMRKVNSVFKAVDEYYDRNIDV